MSTRESAWPLPTAEATERAGSAMAQALAPRLTGVIALEGDLGAGKTTLARALLRSLGVSGAVRSPTYTLVEPYLVSAGRVMHLDLYRLASADEWLGLGLEDDPPDQALWLVEWPDRAGPWLPAARLRLRLALPPAGGRVLEAVWADPQDPARQLFSEHMKNSG